MGEAPSFAFLSLGRLFVCLGDDPPREVESRFAADYTARSTAIARRNAWKSRGRGAMFMFGQTGVPDDALDGPIATTPIRFTGLSRGRDPGELVYSMSTGPVSGLFAFSDGEEQRLSHGTDVQLSEPACAPDGSAIACVLRGADGRSHLGLADARGSNARQVTDGDALDAAPSWSVDGRTLYFESRGLGRDRAGQFAGMGAATVVAFTPSTGAMREVAAASEFDFMAPRAGADDVVYYLKRPVPKARPIDLRTMLFMAVAFPFRLVWALLSYLSVFSTLYTGKPLIHVGGSRAKRGDLRRAAQAGNLLSAASDADADDEAELREHAGSHLVRREANGTETIIAKGVRCFDVHPNGTVLWTSGRKVHIQRPGESVRVLPPLVLPHEAKSDGGPSLSIESIVCLS